MRIQHEANVAAAKKDIEKLREELKLEKEKNKAEEGKLYGDFDTAYTGYEGFLSTYDDELGLALREKGN